MHFYASFTSGHLRESFLLDSSFKVMCLCKHIILKTTTSGMLSGDGEINFEILNSCVAKHICMSLFHNFQATFREYFDFILTTINQLCWRYIYVLYVY